MTKAVGAEWQGRAFAVLLIGSLCCLSACDEGGDDRRAGQNQAMSEEMRERIASLKKEAPSTPTTRENLRERTELVWVWGNALARRGVSLPASLPTSVAAIVRDEDLGGNKGMIAGVPFEQALDTLIYDLTLRDDDEAALGKQSVTAKGPLIADKYSTVTHVFTVGSKPIAIGGVITLAEHMFTDPDSRLQIDDPKADNYLTITSSNKDVRFKPTTTIVNGTFGAFRATRGQLAFEIEGAELKPDDSVAVVYGDTSQGSKGYRLFKSALDHYPLQLLVTFEPGKPYVYLPLMGINIAGDEVAGVHGFAPSIVGVGETFTLSVRSEDRNYNRATGAIPAYEMYANEKLFRKIPAGDNPITLIKDASFSAPGVYRFTIRSEDGRIVGDGNPVLVEENPATRIYWGETHAHSGMAEGMGTSEGLFRFGFEDARLDFLSHTEHDSHLDDGEWETLRANVERFNSADYITFLGYEWTVSVVGGGHHNVIFRTSEGRERVPAQTHPVLSQLYEGLRRKHDLKDVLVVPHAHNAGDWRQSDPGLENLIEIASLHGDFEWFGRAYLANGHDVGFIAASDDHMSHPGYTAPVLAPFSHYYGLAAALAGEKSRDAIFDALKTRAAYATTGRRIILKASLNGGRMGERVAFSPNRRIEGRVIGTTAIDEVAIVKNGEVIKSWEYRNAGTANRFIEIAFTSPSQPIYNSRDNPRHSRPWRGMLRVNGARIASASMPSRYNRRSEFVRPVPGEANALQFSAITRGNFKTILLELADVSAAATLSFDIAEGRELATTPLLYSVPQTLPPTQAVFLLSDLSGGKKRLDVPRDGFYVDSIIVRHLEPTAPSEQSFSFEEKDIVRQGDSYYIRVTQADGARAYSSPFWVGGTPSQ